MKFKEADIAQLAVFDELIQESIETHVKTKVVQRKKRDNDGLVMLDESGNEVWEEHFIPKLKFKKNVEDYNTFRQRKKQYIKELQAKKE